MDTITFKNLFEADNEYGISKILIPKIQRSYAQGRSDTHAVKTRERFLGAIYEALSENRPLTLDFIYGNVRKGCLVPLDGQQRLTTLWLLHWYAARKASVQVEWLSKFTYDTRYSARDFMVRLVYFEPVRKRSLQAEIRNQGWFPMDWNNDSTVSSMLTMLDAIDAKFSDMDDLWNKLDLVRFFFMSVDEMELTDDIYIKMNSRGKPLTDFEHFKAELIKKLRVVADEDSVKRISRKIDIDWTDLFWPYRGGSNIIDDEFLRYFLLICHLITYRRNRSTADIAGKDFFNLIEDIFGGVDSKDNMLFMEKAFDCWVAVAKSNTDSSSPIASFFADYLSEEHEEGKSIPLDRMSSDIFGACLRGYPFERQSPNGQQWLCTFYAFLVYLLNRAKVSDTDFRRRLRIVLNLQKNSGKEVVDNPKGDAGNRMPAILAQVERIILDGVVEPIVEIDGVIRPNFSVSQLKEEKEKLEFTIKNPTLAEALFELEDHALLYGRVEVVGTVNNHLYKRFARLFACDWDAVDCALLATGDYTQRKSNWCVQTGSGDFGSIGRKAWADLFHPTENIRGFEETSRILREFLEKYEHFDDGMLRAIAEDYERQCENGGVYDWRYYYLHYPESFRVRRYGKYTRFEETPYELVALHSEQKESTKAKQCFLCCLGDSFSGGIRLLDFDGKYLRCNNSAFTLLDSDGNVLASLEIPQNGDGIDTVDRIAYFKNNENGLTQNF